MFKKVVLRLKLTLSFVCIAVLLAGASVYQIQTIQHFNALFSELTQNDVKRLGALQEINHLGTKVSAQALQYQRLAVTPAAAAIEKTKLADLSSQLKKSEQNYRDISQNGVAASDIEELHAAIEAVVQKADALIGANSRQLKQQETEVLDAQKNLDTVATRVITAQQTTIDAKTAEVKQVMANLTTIIVALAIAVSTLAVLMGAIVSSWISRAISHLREGAERIANGNFSQPMEVHSHDEIGQLNAAFNGMSDRLKESYRRLDLEQRRSKAMLQSMGEGLIAVDAEGKIALINSMAIELLSLTDERSAVGTPLQDAYQIYAKDDKSDKPLEPDQRPILMALKTGASINDVFMFHKPDGKKHLFNITAEPVKIEDKVVGAVSVLRDVTREKEVDRMKTEFISLASHQLRTPLSAIKWFAEMLVSGDAGKLKPDQQEFAQNIGDSTERMISLVNALLNISRIESGRIMIVPQPTDLKELVTGIVTDLKGKTEIKKQSLIISVHDELPKINLDPRLIGQVYLNLLTNAIKYTQEGGEISVFISKKGDQVVSQVSDNGYGIPKAQQDRVFQKFFRAANAVKVETDGTGLGLYLIKSVIESSGGKIWFESEEGKGTTFWFSIPLSGMKPKEGEVTLDA